MEYRTVQFIRTEGTGPTMTDRVILYGILGGTLLLIWSHIAPASYAQGQQTQTTQHFTSSTTAKQVVDAYKAGVPFKRYVENAIKNTASPDNIIIKNQLSSGN